MCDTWTLSPAQRSPRITCGWSTVRARSPNPTGEFVSFNMFLLVFTLLECYTVTRASLCTFFFQPIYSSCAVHVYCHSRPCLSAVWRAAARCSFTLQWRETRSICSWRSVRARLFLPRLVCEWPAIQLELPACVECFTCIKQDQQRHTNT